MTELIYSGKVTAEHPVGYEKTAAEARPGVSKQWVLDAQWSDLPIEAEEEIQNIWCDNEFGNDNYIYKTTINDLNSSSNKYLVDYLTKKGLKEDESVWIHWWW